MDIEIENHYMWFNWWMRTPRKSYRIGLGQRFVKARQKAKLPPHEGYNDMTEAGSIRNYPPFEPTVTDIRELEKIGLEFENCEAYKKLIFAELGT